MNKDAEGHWKVGRSESNWKCASKVQVTPTWADGVDPDDVERGDPVKIQVTYPYSVCCSRTARRRWQHDPNEQYDSHDYSQLNSSTLPRKSHPPFLVQESPQTSVWGGLILRTSNASPKLRRSRGSTRGKIQRLRLGSGTEQTVTFLRRLMSSACQPSGGHPSPEV